MKQKKKKLNIIFHLYIPEYAMHDLLYCVDLVALIFLQLTLHLLSLVYLRILRDLPFLSPI